MPDNHDIDAVFAQLTDGIADELSQHGLEAEFAALDGDTPAEEIQSRTAAPVAEDGDTTEYPTEGYAVRRGDMVVLSFPVEIRAKLREWADGELATIDDVDTLSDDTLAQIERGKRDALETFRGSLDATELDLNQAMQWVATLRALRTHVSDDIFAGRDGDPGELLGADIIEIAQPILIEAGLPPAAMQIYMAAAGDPFASPDQVVPALQRYGLPADPYFQIFEATASYRRFMGLMMVQSTLLDAVHGPLNV